MKVFRMSIIFLLSTLYLNSQTVAVAAKEVSFQKYANQIIAAALKQLDAQSDDGNLACITNAGYGTYNGQSTHLFLDLVAQKTHISLGRGNLLQVHTASDESIWFAFIQKQSPQNLLLTYIHSADQDILATDPLNVFVDINQAFDEFSNVLGDKAFTIASFANGWADGIPYNLMQGALWHDHLCCGIFSGFFTVDFIRKNLTLHAKDNYSYIGAPSWCQDDYINRELNLTPGKHGYYTMAYPWPRPWVTAAQTYDQLGGLIIRFNSVSQSGEAHLLKFDWREDDFKAFIQKPELELNWSKNPWLHIHYNRFFMQHLHEPEKFVSILKTKILKNQKDLNRLIDMGANPLEEILGPDINWVPTRD